MNSNITTSTNNNNNDKKNVITRQSKLLNENVTVIMRKGQFNRKSSEKV